jgi:4-amino-4-deoxychorismate lyase
LNTLIDGAFQDSIPADDRAVLFGESVFETIAFCGKSAPLWDRHMRRLEQATSELGLAMPDTAILASDCARLIPADNNGRLIIRISVTGGSGGQGYWPPDRPTCRRILQLRPWPETFFQQRKRGLKTIISRFRIRSGGSFSGMKHGSRLLQTQAARECRHRGADEALLLDDSGRLAEALSSNLVLVAGERLLTPAMTEVAGVGLSWLRDRLATRLEFGSVDAEQLESLSEVLVINSVAGIRSVVAIEDQSYQPGPIAKELQSIWHEEISI